MVCGDRKHAETAMPLAGSFGHRPRQGAPERMAADLKLLGDLDRDVIAGTQQRQRLFQIAFLQRLGSAADSSPPASGRGRPDWPDLARKSARVETALSCLSRLNGIQARMPI
jgi:hypothetical protein